MALAAAVWRTPSGIRRTSPTDTLSVDVEAGVSLKPVGSGGEGGIDRVEFSVSQNFGPATVYTVTAEQTRKPNYSSAPSRMPGVSSGMAPMALFGITLACSGAASGIVIAYGRIEVTAVVYSKLGTATPMPDSIVLYNDADGIDRRPNSAVFYVTSSGNDSWDGTSQTYQGGTVGPYASIGKAITGNCSGRRIVVSGNVYWVGPLDGTGFTLDHHLCSIECQPGTVIRRHPTGNTILNTPSGQRFRFRITGMELRGQVLDIQRGSGGNVLAWADGCIRHSEFYSPSRPSTILYESSEEALGGQDFFNFVGETNDNNCRQYASCCAIIGLHKGFANQTAIHDCEVAHIMAEGVVSNNGTNPHGQSVANLYYHDQVAGTHLVRGWFSSLIHDSNLTISTAGLPAGQAKISQTGPMYIAVFGISDDPLTNVDIAWTGDELVGRGGVWDLQLTGTGTAGNNGHFPAVSVGYDGSIPYVIINNPTAVPGALNAGKITTWYVNAPDDPLHPADPQRTVDPHGDIWHGDGPHTNVVLTGLVTKNVWHCQSVFIPTTCTVDRMLIRNWAISNPYTTISDFNFNWLGVTNDAVLVGNTFDCGGIIGGTNTNLCIVDCMFRNINIVPGTNSYIDNNHFVSGTVYGTHASTGPWFSANPIDQSWSYRPQTLRLGTGSGLWFRPPEFLWSGAASDSIGCDRSTGLQDWQTSLPGILVSSGSSSGTSASSAVPLTSRSVSALSAGVSTTALAGVAITYSALGFSSGGGISYARAIIPNPVTTRGTSFGTSDDVAAAVGSVLGAGSSVGSSSDSLLARLSLSAAGGSDGLSSSMSIAYLILGCSGQSDGESFSVCSPEEVGALTGQGTSLGGSSSSASPGLITPTSGSSLGSSQTYAFSPLYLTSAGRSDGLSTSTASAFLLSELMVSKVEAQQKQILMKQRIHNALNALVKAGPFYRCSVNSKTGQMTVDLDKPVTPNGVVIKERGSSYVPARRLRRLFGASDLESWIWSAQVQFPGLEVACEVFEEAATDRGIQIPVVAGLPNQKPLVARLTRCDYSHPPEQSPSSGTLVEFTFEIVPELLRK